MTNNRHSPFRDLRCFTVKIWYLKRPVSASKRTAGFRWVTKVKSLFSATLLETADSDWINELAVLIYPKTRLSLAASEGIITDCEDLDDRLQWTVRLDRCSVNKWKANGFEIEILEDKIPGSQTPPLTNIGGLRDRWIDTRNSSERRQR
jgi:hypothetical protein